MHVTAEKSVTIVLNDEEARLLLSACVLAGCWFDYRITRSANSPSNTEYVAETGRMMTLLGGQLKALGVKEL